MNKCFLLAGAAILLSAAPIVADDHHHHHTASVGEVTVTHAWTRASGQDGDAVVFFEIENEGEPVVLDGAETAIAASVDVVGASMGSDGSVRYEPLGSFTVPGGAFAFDPAGLGLRLQGLNTALEQGDSFELHLLLGDEELEVTVDVEAADARAHSHAGHSH